MVIPLKHVTLQPPAIAQTTVLRQGELYDIFLTNIRTYTHRHTHTLGVKVTFYSSSDVRFTKRLT